MEFYRPPVAMARRAFKASAAFSSLSATSNNLNFTWLDKAYEERFTRLAYLKVEVLWDPLRSDPRFTDLLRRVGIPP